MRQYNYFIKSFSVLAVIAVGALNLTACSSQTPQLVYIEPSPADYRSPHDPGVVNYVYEKPMANVVEVPAGLDPEGVYYMPRHQSVVEIRQGRWTYVEE